MRTMLRSKISLLFMTCAVLLAVPAIALADIVANDLDTTVDNTAEVMGLQVGGANGTSKLYVINQNTSQGDTNNGCNLAGASNLQLDVTSSNPGVATVSPASVTIDDCTTALLGRPSRLRLYLQDRPRSRSPGRRAPTAPPPAPSTLRPLPSPSM